MGVRIDVESTNGLGGLAARAARGLQAGLVAAGERLMTEAVDRAPMDQGTLRDSATVEPSLAGESPSVSVVFDTPYAARLHEHPEYNFSTDSNPNAQGKYLENAALETRDVLRSIIQERVEEAMR